MNYLLFILLPLFSLNAFAKNPELSKFVPKGYVIAEQQYGDLNNDGTKDCVMIIKGTDKRKIIVDEYQGKLDRNRRGIIILFNQKGTYTLASKNYDCFSSENEDGGVYFAPELSIEMKKTQLIIHYGHGRYGTWDFIFKYIQNDFALIGYEQSESNGPVIVRETSINFLTKKKIVRENINVDNGEGKEKFRTNNSSITVKRLMTLSEIKDFDELDMTTY